MLKAFFRSLLLIIFFSLFAGFGIGFIGGLKAGIGGFLLGIIVQLLGGYLWNTHLERKDRMFAETLVSQATETPAVVDLTCAYCNIANHVPLVISKDNVFKCVHCNQTNRVYIQLSTVRLTTPLARNESLDEIPMFLEDDQTVRQTTLNEPIKIGETK